MRDIAVGDDIVLAFKAELAGIARAGLATDGERANKRSKVAAPGRVTPSLRYRCQK